MHIQARIGHRIRDGATSEFGSAWPPVMVGAGWSEGTCWWGWYDGVRPVEQTGADDRDVGGIALPASRFPNSDALCGMKHDMPGMHAFAALSGTHRDILSNERARSPGHAKPYHTVCAVGIAFAAPSRSAFIFRKRIPTPAAKRAKSASRQVHPRPAIARRARVCQMIIILTPLPYVAAHIVQTNPFGSFCPTTCAQFSLTFSALYHHQQYARLSSR